MNGERKTVNGERYMVKGERYTVNGKGLIDYRMASKLTPTLFCYLASDVWHHSPVHLLPFTLYPLTHWPLEILAP